MNLVLSFFLFLVLFLTALADMSQYISDTFFDQRKAFTQTGKRQTKYSSRKHGTYSNKSHPKWPWKNPLNYNVFQDIIKGKVSQKSATSYISYLNLFFEDLFPVNAKILLLWSDECWGEEKIHGVYDQFDEDWKWVGAIRDVKEQLTNVLHTPSLM